MENILLTAFKSASLRYAKGIPGKVSLWDNSLSLDKKAESLSWELQDMGYKLVKVEDKEPTPINTPNILIKEFV